MNKQELYNHLNTTLKVLTEGERHPLPNLANAAALLWELLPDINWAGFYVMDGEGLVLGPFQGKTACIRIALDKGVCGAAAREDKIQRVADVHAFPGHIACDSASNSEIVLPLHDETGRVVGVMDIDSPIFNRFDEEDEVGLTRASLLLSKACDWSRLVSLN